MKTKPACLLGSPDTVIATTKEFLKEAAKEMCKFPVVSMSLADVYLNYWRLVSQCEWSENDKMKVRHELGMIFRKIAGNEEIQ